MYLEDKLSVFVGLLNEWDEELLM